MNIHSIKFLGDTWRKQRPRGLKITPSLFNKITETRARTQLYLKIKIMKIPVKPHSTFIPALYVLLTPEVIFKVLPNVKTKIETQIELEFKNRIKGLVFQSN